MDNRSSKASLLLCAIVLVVWGCKEKITQDNSLTIQEYAKIGMPNPDKIWESHDFALAFSVLENLKSSNPFQLPIKGSDKSGKIFDRLLDTDNMQFLHDDQISVGAKIRFSENFLRICENAVRLYTMPGAGQQYYHQELTDAYIFGLEVSDIMLDLQKEADSNAQVNVLGPVHSFYLSGLFNLLRTQNRASSFSEKDHRKLVNTISRSVLKNKHWFDNEVLKDVKATCVLISDSIALKQYDASYEELLGEL